MFGKKKEAKRAKEFKQDAPALPDKSQTMSAPYSGNTVPPRAYKSSYPLDESTDNILEYPGTWKARRDVPPVPPSVESIPTSVDRNSFDEDEYVAPGLDLPTTEEYYDDPTESLHDSQNTGYSQQNNLRSYQNSFAAPQAFGNSRPQPVTPPDSPEDMYVGPDDLDQGQRMSNGWRPDFQQQDLIAEEMYDNPEDMNEAPPPQLPPPNLSLTRNVPRSPNFSPPPAFPAEQNFPPAPPSTLPPYILSVEENYDLVPDELDTVGGPITPPLDDSEEFYDLPDPALGAEQELVPQFKPPVCPSKPGRPAKAIIPNKPAELSGGAVSELNKRFVNMNAKKETKKHPLVTARGSSGFSHERGAKKLSYPLEESSEPLSPSQVSPKKRPIIQTKNSLPTKAAVVRLEDQVWYKGDFTRNTSDPFLRRYKKDGGFIVRPSTNDGPGFYSFSIYYQGEIRHLRIRLKSNTKYSVGEEKPNELEFDSVVECVDFHRNEPLILKAGGEVCLEVLV